MSGTPLTTIKDGDDVTVTGDSGKPYILRHRGAVYSCTCQAWQFQSVPIERRTCKHLRRYLGDAVEDARLHRMAARPTVADPAPSDVVPTREKWLPNVMLAETWDGVVDPTGWLMSEKMDGVRAYWDGKQLWTRQGNPIITPQWFLDELPDFAVDGELWAGRGKFQDAVSIVRRHDTSDEWKQIHYRIFDAPELSTTSAGITFVSRINYLRSWFDTHPRDHVELLIQVPCEGKDHLLEALAITVKAHGEGIVLRKPDSQYVRGRSQEMLKVKPAYDAEAKIIGYNDGKGKYSGMVGSFQMEMPSGKQFALSGMPDHLRSNPPKAGTIVTYTYRDFTRDGIPRFAAFQRIRTDVTWADVCKSDVVKHVTTLIGAMDEK